MVFNIIENLDLWLVFSLKWLAEKLFIGIAKVMYDNVLINDILFFIEIGDQWSYHTPTHHHHTLLESLKNERKLCIKYFINMQCSSELLLCVQAALYTYRWFVI